MRKRWKIKRIFFSVRTAGFGLDTNGGYVWFSPKSKLFEFKIRHHLPHLLEKLIILHPQTQKDIEAFFTGRYVYGRSMIKNEWYGDYKLLV